ncbi:MAG TPA: hypothetical protein VFI93_07830 [Rhizomicrobium sp.]|nr:hypothetical protein [Rhizomicrobium sp.]
MGVGVMESWKWAGIGGKTVFAVLKRIWRYLDDNGVRPAANQCLFEDEVRELATEYLPILLHKRAKLFAAYGQAAESQWQEELRFFQGRVLLPALGERADYAARHARQVCRVLNRMVCSAQAERDAAQAGSAMPVTSRFDTSWAA